MLDIRDSGPARENGIRSGDVLVGLHVWETLSLQDLAYVLERTELSPGDPVDYHVLRGADVLHGKIRPLNVEK